MNKYRWEELKIRVKRLNELVNDIDKQIQDKSDE